MRVLLLSYHFAPSNSMGAARTTALASHLASCGDDVRVVAGGSASPMQQLPHFGSVKVQRVPADSGLAYRVFARLFGAPSISAGAEGRPNSEHRRPRHPSMRSYASLYGRMICHIPDGFLRWAWRVQGVGIEIAEDWLPDVIVASGPPFSVFLAASRISQRSNVPWLADYRDLWSVSSYYPYPTIRRWLDSRIERLTAKDAGALVTVSEPLATELAAFHHRVCEVVRNGHDSSIYNDQGGPRLAGELSMVYAGRLYSGKRDPTPLFEAIRMLGSDGAGIRVHFAGPDGLEVQALATRLGCLQNVVIHGQVSRDEALDLQHRADILLLLMWNSVGDAGAYPGKLFEYLFARRPILMLGWPHGVSAHLIISRGAGMVLNTPKDIASQLAVWLDTLRTTDGIPRLPVSVTEGLTRREQDLVFEQIIRRVAKKGPSVIPHGQRSSPA